MSNSKHSRRARQAGVTTHRAGARLGEVPAYVIIDEHQAHVVSAAAAVVHEAVVADVLADVDAAQRAVWGPRPGEWTHPYDAAFAKATAVS